MKTGGDLRRNGRADERGRLRFVTASGDASLRLIAGKRVQPVNIDLIPSWKAVDDRLKDAPWHTVDGVHYGVPYMWGPNVLMYNTNVFKTAPTSWKVVFDGDDARRRQAEYRPSAGL